MKYDKTILIIEDEAMMSEALDDKLTREGFSVLVAKDGKEGLKMALKKRPDLILLDIILPKMGGLVMLKELRKNKWGKDAIVIVLTNLDSTDKVAEAVEGGMHEYLIKSNWPINGIVNKVKERLGLIAIH